MGLLDWFRRQPTRDVTPIVFYVRLDETDWAVDIGAWRCAALSIPGAQVEELRTAGQLLRCDEDYRADQQAQMIYWRGEPRTVPKAVAVRIKITQALLTATEASAEKKDATTRTAVVGAISAIVVACITGYAGYRSALNGAQSLRPQVSAEARPDLLNEPATHLFCVQDKGNSPRIIVHCRFDTRDECERYLDVRPWWRDTHECVLRPEP